jgi:hypothetical protein
VHHIKHDNDKFKNQEHNQDGRHQLELPKPGPELILMEADTNKTRVVGSIALECKEKETAMIKFSNDCSLFAYFIQNKIYVLEIGNNIKDIFYKIEHK